MTQHFDVAVLGAGAAGMMAAGVAGQRGQKVVLLDHAKKLAEKIRISGGGRCNFTNLGTTPGQFLSQNAHFCKSALARYTPQDFLGLIRRYGIGWHEKHRGQLFCDESSQQIIDLLRSECDAGNVKWMMPCEVAAIHQAGADRFQLDTNAGAVSARRLIIATGGLSIPPIGATDFGYRIAKQFGHRIVPTRPGLVPLTFAAAEWAPFVSLAGVALPVKVTALNEKGRDRHSFDEDLLFTHRGLSGPAMLQISSYWQPGSLLRIDLVPGRSIQEALIAAKSDSRQLFANCLREWLPQRLAAGWLEANPSMASLAGSRIAETSDKVLRQFAESLHRWQVMPAGTEGFKKAEVTVGGVDTRDLQQQTLESTRVPGLHFVGEVVDVTGWLGGYNFQWAWASGYAAGMAVSA
jgi:predicted Rossmann fold flavoprotein